jgi:hypothetical protein
MELNTTREATRLGFLDRNGFFNEYNTKQNKAILVTGRGGL